ncbi:hypothetical protein D3C78_1509320 [compost metagenome]
MHQNILFQRFDPIINPVSDEEVVVDNTVDEMVKEIIGTVNLLLPKKGLKRAQLIDLLSRYRNDIMASEEDVQSSQENFLVIEAYAVDDHKIVAFVYFDLGTLLILAEAILNSKVMHAK